MVEVFILAEGQTEEAFIKQVVAPALNHLKVFLKPVLMNTSSTSRGGAVTFDRLALNARNLLRQHPEARLSTFLDLYALHTDFPRYQESQNISDVHVRVRRLQDALKDALVVAGQCRPERVLPHIQPYEFEGLLFSDVDALCTAEPQWADSQEALAAVRAAVETPEHINGGYDTHPSKRLASALRPRYRKTTHGPLAAKRITLNVIEQECRHFRSWMDTLRALA